MWDSRGLTEPELFSSWTRWPRLPDASLTQGQNPEWKPLMFLTGCQLCFSLARSVLSLCSLCCSLALSPVILIPLSPLRCPLPALSLIYSLLLPALLLLWSSPTSKWGLTESRSSFPANTVGLVQNYVIFSERCGVQNFSVDSINQL